MIETNNDNFRETLKYLQKVCQQTQKEHEKSRIKLNKRIVQCYLWWREVRTIDGFLEQEYSLLPPIKTKKACDNTNFNRLIYLTFGMQLEYNNVYIYSRAINKIHEQYENNCLFYKENTIDKLVTYMTNNGGISGLSYPKDKTANKPDTDTSESGTQTKTKHNKAKSCSNKSKIDSSIYKTPLHEKYALLLVEKTNDGYKPITNVYDNNLLNELVAEYLDKKSDELPDSTRAMFELLQTQCPQHNLIDVTNNLKTTHDTKLDDLSGQQYIPTRRVMYKHQTNELIISPAKSSSGVITVVKQSKQVFGNIQNDVFLPICFRSQIEKHCLQGYKFNSYKVSNVDTIQELTNSDDASHAIRFDERENPKNVFNITFWPFPKSYSDLHKQIVIDNNYNFVSSWAITLKSDWFVGLNTMFNMPWIKNMANHLTRPEHTILKVSFETTKLILKFVHRDNQFENFQEVSFMDTQASLNSSEFSAHFYSIDLVPALSSIADLTIIGSIEMAVNQDILQLKWVTGAGIYSVYIPTVDINSGQRSQAAFKKYDPIVITAKTPDEIYAEIQAQRQAERPAKIKEIKSYCQLEDEYADILTEEEIMIGV